MKRPSFQWYPGDAQRDMALRSCSLAARGLWREMLDLMHDGEPYGHLATTARAPLEDNQLARIIGEPILVIQQLKVELTNAGVPSITGDGVWYSRRMVRDEKLRETRAICGKMGGNPRLLNQNLNQAPNQKPTPASASASALLIPPTPLFADAEAPKPKRQPRKRAAATTFPEGFEPKQSHIELAAKLGVDLAVEFRRFRDRAVAKGETYANWDSALSYWVRNQHKFNGASRSFAAHA